MDDLRREHPYLKAIIVEDAPASNGLHITLLKNKGFRYILGTKPGDRELLFSWFEASKTEKSWEIRDKKTGTVRHCEWDIGLPLNDANFDLKVNMLKYKETNKKGEIKRFSYQRAHELILFWDAKLFHSGSNSGTPWHFKKGLAHALVGIMGHRPSA